MTHAHFVLGDVHQLGNGNLFVAAYTFSNEIACCSLGNRFFLLSLRRPLQSSGQRLDVNQLTDF
jgi:hypothetical protein